MEKKSSTELDMPGKDQWLSSVVPEVQSQILYNCMLSLNLL